MNDLQIINHGNENLLNIAPISELVKQEQPAQYLGTVIADIVRNNKKGLHENDLGGATLDFYHFMANNEAFNELTPDDLLDAFRKQKDKTYQIKKYGSFDLEFAGEVLRAKIKEIQLSKRDLSNPIGDKANLTIANLTSDQDQEYCKNQILKVIVRSDPKIKTIEEVDLWMVEDVLEAWQEEYFDITPSEMMKAHRRHHAKGEQNGGLYGQDYHPAYFGQIMQAFQLTKRKDAQRNAPQTTDKQRIQDQTRIQRANELDAADYLAIFPKFKGVFNMDVLTAFGFVVGTMENIWDKPYPFSSPPQDVDLTKIIESNNNTSLIDVPGLLESKRINCQKGYLFMLDLEDEQKRIKFIKALKQ